MPAFSSPRTLGPLHPPAAALSEKPRPRLPPWLRIKLPTSDQFAQTQALLDELRGNALPPATPIVILSTSTNPRDIAACYRLGAAGYLCKPLSIDLYVEKLRSLLCYLFETVMLADAGR